MYLARSIQKDKALHFVIIFNTKFESASSTTLNYIWLKAVGIKNLHMLYVMKFKVYDLN